MRPLRIVFLGTPGFGIPSLRKLMDDGHKIVGVVTSPDKPAGRGMKLSQSDVKKFAVEHDLKVLQPTNLKSEEFLDELRDLKADLQVVIAFRMLPEVVWSMPKLGTMNLHASLLPKYRGAAPINHAIMNGEKTTGVTTFLLKHEIDTGDILLQAEVSITDTDNAGSLHDKLMNKGSELVSRSVAMISEENFELQPQNFTGNEPKAPKIHKADCIIDWNSGAKHIYDMIRGLSPYPVARTEFQGGVFKIYEATYVTESHDHTPGEVIISDQQFRFACKDGYIDPIVVQPEGKRRMGIKDFLNGLR